jgi:hypothetical protein
MGCGGCGRGSVPIPINDPKHWSERAEEARVHAEQMTDPDSKQQDCRRVAWPDCLPGCAEAFEP